MGAQMRQANASFRSYVLRPALGRAALISEVSALGLALNGQGNAARRGNLLTDQKKCSVKVWRAQAGCFGAAEWRSLTRLLDPSEQARSNRFHFAADRRAYVLAHGLRRLALAQLLGLPASAAAALRFAHNGAGRPMLIEAPGSARWFFSHAHAREGVLFAASREHPVGIDIEALSQAGQTPDLGSALLRRYMAWPSEAGLDWDSPAGFAKGWTALEAFVKALGCGLPGLQAPVRCTRAGALIENSDALRLSLCAPRLRHMNRMHRHSRQEALVLHLSAIEGCAAALAVCQPALALPPQLDESSLDTDAALLRRLC